MSEELKALEQEIFELKSKLAEYKSCFSENELMQIKDQHFQKGVSASEDLQTLVISQKSNIHFLKGVLYGLKEDLTSKLEIFFNVLDSLRFHDSSSILILKQLLEAIEPLIDSEIAIMIASQVATKVNDNAENTDYPELIITKFPRKN